jgi:hypothetical protein
VEGNTWTYKDDKTSGKYLSHWALGFGSCADRVIDTSSSDGSAAEIGKDGSIKDRDFPGIKWNSEGGTFSFTLDGDYPSNAVEVLAKAGSLQDGGYSTSMVMGPDCSCDSDIVLTGVVDAGDICSYFKSGNVVDPSDIEVPGVVHASYSDGSDASGVAITISSGADDTGVICADGKMSGSCDFETDAGGSVDFTMIAKWPGISAEQKKAIYNAVSTGFTAKTPDEQIESSVGGLVENIGGNYVLNVEGGGGAISLSKTLGWNLGMVSSVDVTSGGQPRIEMTDGCVLTLAKPRRLR